MAGKGVLEILVWGFTMNMVPGLNIQQIQQFVCHTTKLMGQLQAVAVAASQLNDLPSASILNTFPL